MVDISVNELHEMSIGELERCINRMSEELMKRRDAEREEALKEFEDAWFKLYNLGLIPHYFISEDCLPTREGDFPLADFEAFSFI